MRLTGSHIEVAVPPLPGRRGRVRAASSGDTEFFRRRAVRRFASDLETTNLPEELHDPLSRISLRLEQRVDQDDLEPLTEAYAELVELGGNV